MLRPARCLALACLHRPAPLPPPPAPFAEEPPKSDKKQKQESEEGEQKKKVCVLAGGCWGAAAGPRPLALLCWLQALRAWGVGACAPLQCAGVLPEGGAPLAHAARRHLPRAALVAGASSGAHRPVPDHLAHLAPAEEQEAQEGEEGEEGERRERLSCGSQGGAQGLGEPGPGGGAAEGRRRRAGGAGGVCWAGS